MLFYNIIIAPIELVVEFVFELLFRVLGQHKTNQAFAVIGVSLIISLLTLPLYQKADEVQRKERAIQKRLAPGIKRIKDTFKGDERFMILQAFYRENHYSPLFALNGSVSLLLEIPFFIAAYHFLSHLEVLKGASFGLIENLGAQDSLIKIGDLSFNLLPVLMTAINCASSAIYLRGFPLKEKLQVFGMAIIFLFLLYNSPAGLVVYWTCNNIFSLGKNIFYKLKNPRKWINILCASVGLFFSIALFASGMLNSKKKCFFLFLFCIFSFLPLVLSKIKKNKNIITPPRENQHEQQQFLYQAVFLALLTGILIPSSVIASSPIEFIDINNFKNPLHFLVNSVCYAVGFFLFWSLIIYKMLNNNGKRIFSWIMQVFALIGIVNYMFFGNHLGTLSSSLVFEGKVKFSTSEMVLNTAVSAMILFLCIANYKIRSKKASAVMLVLIMGVSVLSAKNIINIQSKISESAYLHDIERDTSGEKPIITLSKTGKNVIVFMLDRAINAFFPMCLEEKPELKEQFSGFTYYPNTISFGGHTIFGAPPLFGGYEYTPSEMEKRADETMIDKHNESLKVLPVLFLQNGFDVTVCDAPLANYQWIPDMSIYRDFPEIKTHIMKGMFNDSINRFYNSNKRNFFCYSIVKISPLILQKTLYDDGNYFESYSSNPLIKEFGQDFVDDYFALYSLQRATSVTEDSKDTFLMMNNEITHCPCILNLPNYDMTADKNDSEYKEKYEFETEAQREHYHVNMATLLMIGKWLDFLKANDVYENTRIIIVADHGYKYEARDAGLNFKSIELKNVPGFKSFYTDCLNPLLIIKDFGAKNLETSSDFMTNADVPAFAVKDIVKNPVNPFTKKPLTTDEKTSHSQFITTSSHFSPPQDRNAKILDVSDGIWLSVHDDIFKAENWTFESHR